MRVVLPDRVELARVSVTLLGGPLVLLQCQRCGHVWQGKQHLSDWLRHDYWHCPRECNVFEPEPEFYTPEPEPKPEPEPEPKSELERLFDKFVASCRATERVTSAVAKTHFAGEAGAAFGAWLSQLIASDVFGDEDSDDETWYLRKSNFMAEAMKRADSEMAKERLQAEYEKSLDRYLSEVEVRNLLEDES